MNEIIDKLAFRTGMYCDQNTSTSREEMIQNFSNALLQDVLQVIQEYGDQQLKRWQNKTTGFNYQPAADCISKLIKDRYNG